MIGPELRGFIRELGVTWPAAAEAKHRRGSGPAKLDTK